VSERHGEFNFFVNLVPMVQRPVLVCFLAADHAVAAEQWSDAETIDRLMPILDAMFGGGKALPRPVASRVTRWRSDPYARGSYAFMKVGATPADVEAIAAGVGRLRFAGEATFIFPGYTHGAFLSGKREATRILNELKPEHSHPACASSQSSFAHSTDMSNQRVQARDIHPLLVSSALPVAM